MAIYLHLPVYKASYDLLLKIFQITKDVPREYKYSVGQDLRHSVAELIKCIYVANSATDKASALAECRACVETTRLYLRLLHDLRVISIDQYITTAELNETVSKQLAKWQASQRRPESSMAKA